MDTRNFVDCAFFIRGTCGKGSACPFRHDPSKITVLRQEQGQKDCIFFLQGRCTKGSLCPFRHDSAKVPVNTQGGAAAPQPAAAAAVTVDFGPADQQPPGILPAAQPASQPPRKHPPGAPVLATAATAPRPTAVQEAAPSRHQQQKQQPAAPGAAGRLTPSKAQAARTSASTAAEGGLPSRLAGRLGPAVAPSGADRPSSRGQADARPASRQRDAEAADRAPRRRAAGGLGVALSALHDVLGDTHEVAGSKGTAYGSAEAQRKRRLASDSEDQSAAEEGEHAPPAVKRAAAAGAGQARPRAVPAPPPPAAQPREQAIPAPKSIEEIRRERRLQRFAPSQGNKAPAANTPTGGATTGSGRKHAPIAFKAEQAASPATSPSAVASAAQPAPQPAKPSVQLASSNRDNPQSNQGAAEGPKAVNEHPMEQHPHVKEMAIEHYDDLDLEGLDGQEGEGAANVDDEDDFEAQMRALEEGL